MKYAIPLLLVALLAGCASSGGQVPGGARLVAESPAPLSFGATEAGTVYVRERASGRVVFDARLEAGERFDADPVSGRVTAGGKPAAVTLGAGAPYEVFFKPAGKREYHPAYNP